MNKDALHDEALLKILKDKASSTIAVFGRGEYFNVYGDDERFVATNIFKSDVCLKNVTLQTGETMKYVAVNRGQYEKVVRETIVLLRCSVELYQSQGGVWTMTKRGSPGNTVDFEQEVGVADQAPIFAVYLHPSDTDNRVTLCAWDAANVRIIVSEFNDTPAFSQVEQCIFGLCPTEYILMNTDSTSAAAKKLSNMFVKMDVYQKPRNLGESLKPKSDWEEVMKCVVENSKKEFEATSVSVKECIQMLHANYSNEYGEMEKYSIHNYGSHGIMHLDSGAVEALELFQLNYNYLEKNTNLTLFNVINKCKTLPGEKMLRDWISHPLCEIDTINSRLDIVEGLMENPSIRLKLRDSLLARMPDCSQLARKLMRKTMLNDLNRFYQATMILDNIDHKLDELAKSMDGKAENAVNNLLKKDMETILEKVVRFQGLCEEFFDFEYEKENKEIRVRVDLVPEIQNVKDKLEHVEELAQKLRKKYSARLGLDNMKLDKNAQYGYYFRCTLKDEKILRKSTVNILETTKGSGIKFNLPELADINEEFMDLHLKYIKAEEQVVAMLCEKSKEFIPLIPAISNICATLDVLVSMATFSEMSSKLYTRPKLLPMGSKKLKLIQCRHPVIESTSTKPYIPNDVILDNDRLIVLTGANMGGKSTYLRSAALSILLAQIGCFVPCDSAEISVIDGIYTRVGASDKQSKGISTFMAEMLDCAAILQRAGENSFVVIDELGRGTSTFDGYGIASAIAQDILNRIKCLCIFATHFHEMGELAQQDGAVALQMGVQIENNEIHMLYKVLDGVAQCSFGLQVAKMVGLNEKVVEKAANLLDVLERKTAVDKEKLLNSGDLRAAILELEAN
ncbi:unnamed protein product [Caenorhabditis angaria]|uniref:DNA mismatch repair proteins mutS family domain-containing protein n=1 Tax=Caenorhabditis angaria TaxID=860376 RepID=A0A9P1I6X2_9PELO|nr:unnamed protein product [Caenorhabditis angaria]